MTYLNAKKYISAASVTKERGKSNILALLDSLGNPHRRLKCLRLAGNNGKTVCAEMLTSVLRYGGYTVGCLKMPLREEPKDNICIGSSSLDMDKFAEYTKQIKTISATLPFIPTQSEMLLAISLIAFKDASCDICIIESDHFGDDPSKFLPPPVAAVICGTIPSDDIDQISRIRSYICKGIEEIVSVPQNSEAYRIISDTCYSANCRLTIASRNAIKINRLSFSGTEFSYKGTNFSLSLCGKFQISNAVLILETLEMLSRRGFRISNDAISAGLSSLRIPAKFEAISISPAIIIDSTHTPVAINTVCDSLCDFKEQTGTNIRLCLPAGEIISNYVTALESRGYFIESILTNDDSYQIPERELLVFKDRKKLLKKAVEGLERGTTLLISGDHKFVVPVRRGLLELLGFRF